MKKHFNKILIMTEKEQQLQSSNTCWVCEKLIDDEKVRDHCYITGKFRGAAHWSCNVNCCNFHNSKGYDSHLIFNELGKLDVKIDVIPNRLEKYMAFTVNKNLFFIYTVQFMNSSLEKLVKNLSDNDFKYLTQEFGPENLELLKQKDAYPYDYMNSFERFFEEKLSDKNFFTSL